MRKLIMILLVLAMCMSIVSLTAFAEETPSISVSSETVAAGDEVTLTASLENNPGVALVAVEVTYDADALELVSMSGAIDGSNLVCVVETGKASWIGSADSTYNGEFLTMTFKVSEDAAAGELDVTVTATEAYNWDEEDVVFTAGTGTITVDPCVNGHEETAWPSETYNDDGSITREYYCVNCNEVLHTETLLPGDEGNPIYLMTMDCPKETVEIAAGEATYYNLLYFSGYYVTITGEDAYATVSKTDWYGNVLSTTTYEAVDGVVTFYATDRSMLVEIGNNGSEAATYTIDYVIPVGHSENPADLVIGENTAELTEGNQSGYFFNWTADCNGTLTVTVSGEYWSYYMTNLTTYQYGDIHNFDDETVVPTDSIEFKAGDVIEINVAMAFLDETTYEWVFPEGTITVDVAVEYEHTIEHVEAVTPGCETEGNVEYWYCTTCGYAWLDEECTMVTNLLSVILPPTHQNVEHVEAVEPGCETEGNIEYWYCKDCGYAWEDEALLKVTNLQSVILPATHQNVIHVEAIEPGCHYEGNKEYWYCADCLTVWENEGQTMVSNFKNVILPELGGDLTHVEAKDATCLENGNIEHWYCEKCQQVWQDEAMTQLTNHKNVIIGAHGHIDEDANEVCDVCGADLSNPKDGDVVAVVAAAAFVSLMGVVALPVMKKKFN